MSESRDTRLISVDGNEAAARIAYQLSEICAIYPITPSSTMAELADEWASKKTPNIWGHVPEVIEMQSEGGAAGAAAVIRQPVRRTARSKRPRSSGLRLPVYC